MFSLPKLTHEENAERTGWRGARLLCSPVWSAWSCWSCWMRPLQRRLSSRCTGFNCSIAGDGEHR